MFIYNEKDKVGNQLALEKVRRQHGEAYWLKEEEDE